MRVQSSWDVETTTTVIALRSLARRFRALTIEAKEHEKSIRAIVRVWRPDRLEEFGVGAIVAATVLCAWSHPGRIHSEAAFAMLVGVAPIPANSGQVTNRYCLNRFGDRQPNRALHIIVQSRIRYDGPSHHRGQDRPRDQTLPLALHRPRPLPTTRNGPNHRLTNHRSVALGPVVDLRSMTCTRPDPLACWCSGRMQR